MGILFLEDITPYHIEQLKAELKKTGLIKDPEKAKELSKATVNRYLQILRGMFYKAIDWEIYKKPNPVKKVRFYYVFDIPNRHQQDLFRRTTKRIQKLTGIPFHFHLLRHYFASSLVEKGVDLLTVSEILGHSKTMVSLGYVHTDMERKRRAVELLNL